MVTKRGGGAMATTLLHQNNNIKHRIYILHPLEMFNRSIYVSETKYVMLLYLGILYIL